MASLTMREAKERSALLTVEAYELDVDLTAAAGAGTFRSTTTVRFTATASGAGTFAEVRPVRLHAARLNGVELDPATLAGGRLPLTDLAPGNELVVTAEYAYSQASEGMHRFVDPADGETYVYAQPAIAAAPAFMGCFDQPDLKAPVTLRVTADPRWAVRATGEGKQVAEGVWQFEPTLPLPTYLITLAAGPYQARITTHDRIPLGLHARASLAEHLERQADELFEVTAACLDRYHELFGIRYPFGKYDQVFAPEFSWGAMEFPGCVLIRDEHVFRSAVTDTERQRRAVLVAHEMAHMWFGNLVTMRWWDDLWLNESFADYLGWRVVAEATQWRGAWAAYGIASKAWGMAADQRPSTHPVAAAEVADTDAALANFDGISYAKGSAVLRQLVAWVGEEACWRGLREHLETHAYGNATLADLLGALSRASGRDLTAWAEQWLRRPGVDTLHPEATIGPDGRYAAVHVRQYGPDPAARRPHRIWVAVYRPGDGASASAGAGAGDAVIRQERCLVDLEPERDLGRTPVPGLAGGPPGLLLVNDGDLTYAKLRLEAAGSGSASSLAGLVAETLPRVADPLARVLLWRAVWDACRDAELPAGRVVTLAAAALPAETEGAVFETMVAVTAGTVVDTYLPPADRPAARARLGEACRTVLAGAAPGSSPQLAAARGRLAYAGPDDVGWLQDWLVGTGVPDGLEVDADLRWAILARLASLGAAGEDRIAAEAERDRSARGAQAAIRCRAARPDPAAKEQAWRLLMSDRSLSNRMLVGVAEGFWQPDQPELTAPFVERYFAEIGATAGWRTPQLLGAVTTAAYPSYAVDAATLALAQERLGRDDLDPTVRRRLVDATDDLRRAVAARALAERTVSARTVWERTGSERTVSERAAGHEGGVAG